MPFILNSRYASYVAPKVEFHAQIRSVKRVVDMRLVIKSEVRCSQKVEEAFLSLMKYPL